MFTYSDGSEIHVGDEVLLENGQIPGTIELMVNTLEEMKDIGTMEPGIMLKSAPFGRVFLPKWSLEEDPLRFVSRE